LAICNDWMLFYVNYSGITFYILDFLYFLLLNTSVYIRISFYQGARALQHVVDIRVSIAIEEKRMHESQNMPVVR